MKKCIACGMPMNTPSEFAMGDTSAWLHYGLFKRLIYLSGLVTLGGVSYFATLMLLGFKPRDYIRRVAH